MLTGRTDASWFVVYLHGGVSLAELYAFTLANHLWQSLYGGEEEEQAYCRQYAAVDDTDGRAEEAADDKHQARCQCNVKCLHNRCLEKEELRMSHSKLFT